MDGDVLVTFDADGQHRIDDIKNVIKPIVNQEADLVIGSRFLDESEKEVPQYRKVGIKVITKITNASIKKQLTDSQSGFRAYSKKVVDELIRIQEYQKVYISIYTWVTINIYRHKRLLKKMRLAGFDL